MKDFFGFVLPFAFFCASCATQARIISPNKLHGAHATIYLENGDSVYGKVTLNNEVLFPKDIVVHPESGDTKEFHLMDVKAYNADNGFFELKHTSNHWRPSSGFYFMKRLTQEGSSFHLYQNTERKQKGKSLSDITYEPVYYLQLPGEKQHRVYPVSGKKLVPHFDKKMSRLIKDCPELANKIIRRKKGYHYNRLTATEEQRKEILLRIISEYDTCNKASGK